MLFCSPVVQAKEQIYYEAIITMAAEISTIEVFVDDGAYSIEINGGIERLAVWVGALKMIPDNTDFSIVLSSPGGPVEETEKIIEQIKNKCAPKDAQSTEKSCVVTTVVDQSKSCVSACTYIFAAGDVRAASAGAVFGFHAAAAFLDFGGYEMAPPERAVAAYLKYSDVDPKWIDQQIALGVFSQVEITWYSREDLKNSNFVTLWL